MIGDVGEDSGFARRETILREKKEEACEKIVDGDGGRRQQEIQAEGSEAGGGEATTADSSPVGRVKKPRR